jgi:predicted CXXCH cytochrome family protein
MRPTILLLAIALASPAYAASIVGSKHDLSATGSRTVQAASETEVCIFCHTPHRASTIAPLWNRNNSTASYTPYSSTTAKASIGQPTGSSKLCLSCHDGTVALGMVLSRGTAIAMKGGITTLPAGASNLGTDLSDDHPISFQYDAALVAADGQLKNPPVSGAVRLDAGGNLQCSSCHTPHDPQYGKFLAKDNTASALCTTCHNISGWNATIHATSTKTWNGTGTDPWPHTDYTTVAANGCEGCHDPHGAPGKKRLLNYAAEESNCYPCHSGTIVSPATKNIQAEFSKTSVHPITTTTGTHDPTEAILVPAGTGHHVECHDCHNAHAATTTGASIVGGATGAQNGVAGINAAGSSVTQITYEYELCFRCHGDTAKGPSLVTRAYVSINTRLEFSNMGGTNSFHPVILTGRNTDVPSLKSPWTITSKLACSHCHNNNAGPNNGGTGPNGPHGSTVRPILERAYNIGNTAATTSNSALCYKCHNFVDTAFKHATHTQRTSCATCHDPHGSPQKHLINFNTAVVSGARTYVSTGTRHGYCNLTCHSTVHSSTQKSY